MRVGQAFAVSALALATNSCSVMSDSKICATPPPLDASPQAISDANSKQADPYYQQTMATDCVNRWAYRLAKSPDPAPVVADAVMGACADLVFRLAYAQENDSKRRGKNENGFDSFTGLEANRYALTAKEMRRQALFSVVQARAGKCGVP